MGRSGIKWVDALFNGSVRALYDLAAVFGVTYEEINVWLFVIAWPVVTVGLMAAVIWLLRENSHLRASCLALRGAGASKREDGVREPHR